MSYHDFIINRGEWTEGDEPSEMIVRDENTEYKLGMQDDEFVDAVRVMVAQLDDDELDRALEVIDEFD